MTTVLRHKNYSGVIEFSAEDDCFIGHIVGIKDIVGFHGDSASELRSAFEASVDDYLETCEKIGKEPQQPDEG